MDARQLTEQSRSGLNEPAGYCINNKGIFMTNGKYTTAEEAVKLVQSGHRVFLHGSAATPVYLIKALQKRHEVLTNVELVSITTMGDVNFDAPEFRKSFFFN